jgi:hypothetical protein
MSEKKTKEPMNGQVPATKTKMLPPGVVQITFSYTMESMSMGDSR